MSCTLVRNFVFPSISRIAGVLEEVELGMIAI
jgi:hypothetical protein